MMEYTEEYKQIRESWIKKPDYIKEYYNRNFATSKHAKKLPIGVNNMQNIKEIMEIDLENLKRKQFESYKAFVLDKLRRITQYIEKDDFEYVKEYLFYSPAGDECGLDNHCINFSYDENKDMDISEAMDLLEWLCDKENEFDL